MLYGYPGAGKTYFARQLSDNMQLAHLQADRIRAELFEQPRYDKQENEVVSQLMNYMAQEFLNAGVSVVYDASVPRVAQRRQLRDMARKSGAAPLVVWLQVDADTAFARGLKRDRRRADDKYAAQHTQATFDQARRAMQNPTNNEDYTVISGKHVFSTQYSAVSHLLRQHGLISMDDTGAHRAKPNLVNLVPSPTSGRVDMSRRNIVIR